MLVRTVADGGESFYVCGRHSDTIPALWGAINKKKSLTNYKTSSIVCREIGEGRYKFYNVSSL